MAHLYGKIASQSAFKLHFYLKTGVGVSQLEPYFRESFLFPFFYPL